LNPLGKGLGLETVSDSRTGERPLDPDDETRRARDRLAVLGEIAAEVAHELRNVFQIISASAYVARQAPAECASHLAKIERSARLGQSIVDDLMALARGEDRRIEATLLADVLGAARADIEAGAASFDDRVDPRLVRAHVHAGLASRLFHVLYENAIAVSAPRPPRIETRARVEGGHLVVEVEDDGPGVPGAIAGRIFEPLVTARAGGTGLGLALARRIASALDGRVELASPGGDGRGACFRVELPVED